jgi:hypothetical protein
MRWCAYGCRTEEDFKAEDPVAYKKSQTQAAKDRRVKEIWDRYSCSGTLAQDLKDVYHI